MQNAKKRRVTGGALFVNGSQFFQRTFAQEAVAAMRDEMMTQGLPSVDCESEGENDEHTAMSTSLPYGAWEVRVVEADECTNTVNVTLWPADGEDKDLGDEAKQLHSMLRLERTFKLPAGVDVTRVHVETDEAGHRLFVTAPTKGTAKSLPSIAEEPIAEAAARILEERSTSVEQPPAVFEAGPTEPSKKPRRRGGKAHGSGMKAGFFNKPKKAAPTPPTSPTVPTMIDENTAPAPPTAVPMEVDQEHVKAPAGRKGSPETVISADEPPASPPYPPNFSVNGDLDQAIRAQMMEMMQEQV